jgi:flagellar M-ring protein FliF
MLEPVVGANKVVARVAADVDFRQVSVSEESYDPDSAVVRSEQVQKESSSHGQGLPGGSPDMKYQVVEQQSASGTGRSTQGFEKENSVINYEINRVNRQIVNSVGDITRLTAAVVIDGPYTPSTEQEGETTRQFSPRSRREMKTFEEIVMKAIGYSEQRGDQVTVSNIPFAMRGAEGTMAGVQSDPAWMSYAKKMSKPALNLLLIALFFFLAIRPFRKWLSQAGQQQVLLRQGSDTPQLEGGGAKGSPEMEQQTQLLELTKKNPEMAADIIRSWLSEGSA